MTGGRHEVGSERKIVTIGSILFCGFSGCCPSSISLHCVIRKDVKKERQRTSACVLLSSVHEPFPPSSWPSTDPTLFLTVVMMKEK